MSISGGIFWKDLTDKGVVSRDLNEGRGGPCGDPGGE